MTIYILTYSFSYLEPVCCFMSSSNCCFLTCIQVSQEAGQVVKYSHLFKTFQQLIVIHIVKGFGIVKKKKYMFFCNFLAFFVIRWMLAIWSLVPLSFLKPVWTSGSSEFIYSRSLAWRILSITLLVHVQFSSVTQSCPTLQTHESQHTRPPCPSPTPGVHSDSRPLS